MMKKITITKWTTVLLLICFSTVGWSQTTLAVQDFETIPATPTLSFTNTAGSIGTLTPGTPAGATTVFAGSRGFYKSNGTAVFTSSVDTDTRCYSSPSLSFKLAALSTGATLGMSATDQVTIAISTNSGASYSNEMTISGNTNAYWSYTSGLATASSSYDGNSTVEGAKAWAPAAGGSRTTDGFSTVTLTGIPNTANLRIKITLVTNATTKIWAIDSVSLTNASPATSTPSLPIATTNFTCGAGTVLLSASGAGSGQDYKWYSALTAGVLLQTGGATFTTPSIAATTTYYVSVYNTAVTTCESSPRVAVVATVTPVSVSGTVSANQSICVGSQPANITLTGSTGSIQWQSSTDNITFTAIAGATTSIVTGASIGALTATRYYRAVVTSGACSSAISGVVKVTVSPTSVAGTVSANQTICTGTQPAAIILTGSVGTIQWQSSTNNTTFANIVGATASTLSGATIGNLTATRYYRAIVTSGACTLATTGVVTVTVSATSVGGTVSANKTICTGNQPANITLTGSRGTIQWQSSTDNITFTAIAGATTSPLTGASIGILTATRYFRAVLTSGACSSATSGVVTVTVSPTSVAGIVSANQSICTGTAPANIILTGSVGTIQWQSSTNNTTFGNIAGATASTLLGTTIGNLSATRYYRARVTSGSCTLAYSSAVTVTVSPTSVAGTVSANQTICTGNQPANITLTGSRGTIQWQSSPDNITFTAIAGATTTPLTGASIGILTATRYFRAVVTSGACSLATSGVVKVTVSPTAVAGTVSANQSICTGTQPAPIILTGNTGTIQWQSSTNNTTFTNIAGATSATLASATMGNLTATRYYRAIVTSTGCTVATTSAVTVTVSLTSLAGTVSANQTICTGNQPATITLTGSRGTVQWQSSSDNVTFTVIAGATTTSLTGATIGTLTATRYFRAVLTSGACSSVTSGVVTVTVSPTSVAGTVSANQTICSGTQPATITLTGNVGSIQWQSSTNNITFTNIVGATASTLSGATIANLIATRYYRAIVTSGTCTLATTGVVTVTVTATSVAGTVSANQAICSGSQPANITLTGSTGTIQWQSSADNLTFTNITGATSSVLTGASIGILTATRYYRAIVSVGSCSSSSVGVVTVTVSPTSVAGTVSANQTICTGDQPASITLTGTIGTIQWQSSTNNSSFTDIVGATTSTLSSTTIGALTATTYYRAVSTSGVCSSANSSSVTITVNIPVAPQFSVVAPICSGAILSDLPTTSNDGFTGTWSPGLDNTTTTTYTFTPTTGQCTTTTSLTITVNTPVVPVFSLPTSICSGDSLVLPTTSNNGFTGTWSPAFDATNTTTYTFTPTIGQCVTTITKTITVNPLPIVSITDNSGSSTCSNTVVTFTLTGTTDAVVTYTLNGGSNTTITLTSGTATITIPSASVNQILTLVSISDGTCTANLNVTDTVAVSNPTTWNGTAWSNGNPTSTSTVLFNGDYTIESDFAACTITVGANANVVVSSGLNVSLYGSLTVLSGSFTIENNANLIQSTTVANSGNIIVKREGSALLRQDYALWSSPVSGQNLVAFSPLTLTNRFYTYATTHAPTNNVYVAIDPTTNSFADAKGYLIRVPNPSSDIVRTNYLGAFTGVPHNGTYSITMDDNGVGQRFNLVGNPYPSPISMTTFVSENSNITGTLYFWRKTNNSASPSYCSWAGGVFTSNGEAQVVDPAGVIQTGQGFFVEGNGNGTSLSFTNSQRVGNNFANQFFRTTSNVQHNVLWLNATSAAGAFSQMAVGYHTDATPGVDFYDGKFYNDGGIALSSIIEATNYAIQGRALPFDPTDKVLLSFKAKTAGDYTIALDHTNGFFSDFQDIFLKDNLTGEIHDLKSGSYVFASDAGTFNSRFEIVYQKALAVANPTLTSNTVIIYSQNNDFVVNSGKIIMSSVKVFDIRGRILQEQKNINANQIKLNKGTTNEVLLFKITTVDGAIVTKKVIR